MSKQIKLVHGVDYRNLIYQCPYFPGEMYMNYQLYQLIMGLVSKYTIESWIQLITDQDGREHEDKSTSIFMEKSTVSPQWKISEISCRMTHSDHALICTSAFAKKRRNSCIIWGSILGGRHSLQCVAHIIRGIAWRNRCTCTMCRHFSFYNLLTSVWLIYRVIRWHLAQWDKEDKASASD